jgi:hypothetical protein
MFGLCRKADIARHAIQPATVFEFNDYVGRQWPRESARRKSDVTPYYLCVQKESFVVPGFVPLATRNVPIATLAAVLREPSVLAQQRIQKRVNARLAKVV